MRPFLFPSFREDSQQLRGVKCPIRFPVLGWLVVS